MATRCRAVPNRRRWAARPWPARGRGGGPDRKNRVGRVISWGSGAGLRTPARCSGRKLPNRFTRSVSCARYRSGQDTDLVKGLVFPSASRMPRRLFGGAPRRVHDQLNRPADSIRVGRHRSGAKALAPRQPGRSRGHRFPARLNPDVMRLRPLCADATEASNLFGDACHQFGCQCRQVACARAPGRTE